jgi:hypothetical protein
MIRQLTRGLCTDIYIRIKVRVRVKIRVRVRARVREIHVLSGDD